MNSRICACGSTLAIDRGCARRVEPDGCQLAEALLAHRLQAPSGGTDRLAAARPRADSAHDTLRRDDGRYFSCTLERYARIAVIRPRTIAFASALPTFGVFASSSLHIGMTRPRCAGMSSAPLTIS